MYLQIADHLCFCDVFNVVHGGFHKPCNPSGTVESSEKIISDEGVSVAEQRRWVVFSRAMVPSVIVMNPY